MIIDLSKIDERGITIDETFSFDDNYLNKTSIKKLDNVKAQGRIYLSITGEIIFDCHIKGVFILEDAIDLSEVEDPFSFDISEVLSENNDELAKKEEKTLDIIDILWQNIVLEVPISFRAHPEKKVSAKGNGWELLDEETETIDPRLAPLLELLESEGKEN